MKYDIFTIGYTFLCFKANDQALHVEIGKEHHFITSSKKKKKEHHFIMGNANE